MAFILYLLLIYQGFIAYFPMSHMGLGNSQSLSMFSTLQMMYRIKMRTMPTVTCPKARGTSIVTARQKRDTWEIGIWATRDQDQDVHLFLFFIFFANHQSVLESFRRGNGFQIQGASKTISWSSLSQGLPWTQPLEMICILLAVCGHRMHTVHNCQDCTNFQDQVPKKDTGFVKAKQNW